EQTGLAGVRVARDRHGRDPVSLAVGLLRLAGTAQLLEFAAQFGDAVLDAAAVGLEFGLARSATTDALAARGTSAGLARQVAAPATKALLLVRQLGEFDLGLALGALGVLGEDVEDEGRAIDDLDLDAVLEVAQLAGRELAVADDGVGAAGL